MLFCAAFQSSCGIRDAPSCARYPANASGKLAVAGKMSMRSNYLDLIDSFGRLQSSQSNELRRRLGTDMSGDRLATYLIRNLGYIQVRWQGPRLSILLRSKSVSNPALIALVALVNSRSDCIPTLKEYGSDLAGRLFRDVSEFCAHVEALRCDRQQVPALRLERFVCRPIKSGSSPFARSIGPCSWALEEIDDIDTLESYVRFLVGDRYTILVGTTLDDLRIQRIGNGVARSNRRWAQTAVNSRFSQHPDQTFGHWVEQGLQETIKSGAPRLEAVEASIHRVSLGVERMTYDRMMIPARQSRSKLLVALNATIVRSSAALR
jgi:hypothetical protein